MNFLKELTDLANHIESIQYGLSENSRQVAGMTVIIIRENLVRLSEGINFDQHPDMAYELEDFIQRTKAKFGVKE